VRITSKGQVTIPIQVRERYGLHPGDEIEFVDDEGGPRVIKRRGAASRGERAARRLEGSATRDLGMTTDELMALLRDGD